MHRREYERSWRSETQLGRELRAPRKISALDVRQAILGRCGRGGMCIFGLCLVLALAGKRFLLVARLAVDRDGCGLDSAGCGIAVRNPLLARAGILRFAASKFCLLAHPFGVDDGALQCSSRRQESYCRAMGVGSPDQSGDHVWIKTVRPRPEGRAGTQCLKAR